MLEQADHTFARIEQLVKSLDLRLEEEKERPPRPTHVLDNKLVLFQAEVLWSVAFLRKISVCRRALTTRRSTYNAVADGELSAKRGDYLNVYAVDGPHYMCELNGKGGAFPIGLSKKLEGSEAGVPKELLAREQSKAFRPGIDALLDLRHREAASGARLRESAVERAVSL